MQIDPLTAARVRIALLQAKTLKSFDESKHPRDSHGHWTAGDRVQFHKWGGQPGSPKTQGTIVKPGHGMTHIVQDDGGDQHEVPTENLEPLGPLDDDEYDYVAGENPLNDPAYRQFYRSRGTK